MRGAWPTARLADLAAPLKGAIAGGPFGSDLVSADYVEEGVPVIRGVNLPFDRKISLDNLVFVSEAKADALHLNCAAPGDLVFTQRGTLGQVGLLPRHLCYSRYLISQSQMKMTVDAKMASALYLYYYFRLRSSVTYIENHALQSGVPHINLGILRKLEVILPPLSVQHRIAAILEAYDDLIANNQRRIALLESMAEEIYREWFVRMRFPEYERAEFFAGRPVAWQPTRLGHVLQLRYGKALPESQRVPGPYRVYGSAGVVGTHSEALVAKPSIVVGRKGNVGSIFWASKPFYPIDTVYYVESELPLTYLRFLLAGMNFINSDAAVPGLNREQAYANEVLLPQDSLLSRFEEIVGPLYRQIEALEDQVACLGSMRDALLPRLISGKLRVEALDIQFPPSMQALRPEEAAQPAVQVS